MTPDSNLPQCICDRDTIADGMATPGCPTHAPDEAVSYPPLIVWRRDLDRLRSYGSRNRCADSAATLRHLLDRADA